MNPMSLDGSPKVTGRSANGLAADGTSTGRNTIAPPHGIGMVRSPSAGAGLDHFVSQSAARTPIGRAAASTANKKPERLIMAC